MNTRSAVIETKAMLNTNKYHMAIIEEGTGQLIHATSPARQGGLLIIYLFLFTSRFTWQFLNLVLKSIYSQYMVYYRRVAGQNTLHPCPLNTNAQHPGSVVDLCWSIHLAVKNGENRTLEKKTKHTNLPARWPMPSFLGRHLGVNKHIYLD